MTNVVKFPKNIRRKRRPKDRSYSAPVALFPLLRASARDFVDEATISAASKFGYETVDSALRQLIEADYWRVQNLAERELMMLRGQMIRRANEIRRSFGLPDREPTDDQPSWSNPPPEAA